MHTWCIYDQSIGPQEIISARDLLPSQCRSKHSIFRSYIVKYYEVLVDPVKYLFFTWVVTKLI